MKKSISTSVAVLVIALVIGGVGVFYYAFMVRPQKYTVMVDPMMAGAEKAAKSNAADDSPRKARRDNKK